MSDEEPDGATDDPTETSDPTDSAAHPRTAEVKTAPDGTPIERTTPPEQWERIGRRALADVLRHRRDEVEREIQQAVSAIEYGAPVDEDHVRNLRGAIEILELAVEKRLVPLVADLEPWERTVGRIPYGRMYDALETDGDDVRRMKETHVGE